MATRWTPSTHAATDGLAQCPLLHVVWCRGQAGAPDFIPVLVFLVPSLFFVFLMVNGLIFVSLMCFEYHFIIS